jgi:hypothetical protein
MYTLYTDKSEEFKCKIGVEGSDLSSTRARLVIEGKDLSLLFEGTIDSDGNCSVPIKRLKNLISESEAGKMKLEVIADDTFFSPWEDDFVVKTDKKVTVEVEQKNNNVIKETKVGVTVSMPTVGKQTIVETPKPKVIETPKETNHGKIISEMLSKRGITVSNIKEHKSTIIKTIKTYVSNNKVSTTTDKLLDEIINNLTF